MTASVDWQIDDSSLETSTACLDAKHGAAWFVLCREAEQLALRPSLDQLITLDHNTIKELPPQMKSPAPDRPCAWNCELRTI